MPEKKFEWDVETAERGNILIVATVSQLSLTKITSSEWKLKMDLNDRGRFMEWTINGREGRRMEKWIAKRAAATIQPEPEGWECIYHGARCRRYCRLTGTEGSWVKYEIGEIRVDDNENEHPFEIICHAKKNFGGFLKIHPYTDELKARVEHERGRGLYSFSYGWGDDKSIRSGGAANPSDHYYRSKHKVHI